MKRISASDAKNRFGSLLDEAAMDGCVEIVKHGRVVGVLLSPKAYEALERAARPRASERWSSAHMIDPASAKAARLIRRPAGFDE